MTEKLTWRANRHALGAHPERYSCCTVPGGAAKDTRCEGAEMEEEESKMEDDLIPSVSEIRVQRRLLQPMPEGIWDRRMVKQATELADRVQCVARGYLSAALGNG